MFFFFLGLIFVALGSLPLVFAIAKSGSMERSQLRGRLKTGVIVLVADILLLIGINVFFGFYTDFLWFNSLGYRRRFWTVLQSQLIFYALGAGFSFIVLYTTTKLTGLNIPSRLGRFGPVSVSLVLALILGVWTANLWDRFLLYIHQSPSSVTDPIFGRSVGFYLFSLPFFSAILGWLIFLVILDLLVIGVVSMIAAGSSGQLSGGQGGGPQEQQERPVQGPDFVGRASRVFLFVLGLFLLLLAWNAYLGIFRLMFSTQGVVTGAGYVDVYYRALGYKVTIGVYGVVGFLLIAGALYRRIRERTFGLRPDAESLHQAVTGRTFLIPGAAVLLLVVFNWVIPAVVTGFVVSPNEVTLEKPFILHNIRFTRAGFGIGDDRIQEKKPPIGRDIGRDVTEKNEQTLMNVRLWDWRALLDNLSQQQEIRLYYEFHDVDIDRYMLNGDYRQVMLAVREMEIGSLAPESQTWVSRHLKYTHGYGLVLTPVHEIEPQGRPRLLIRGIPPEEDFESIEIERPEIYYGERTRQHVYVKTSEQEFDYPLGDENVYATYEGSGGVTMGSFFRKFVFAWKFDGVNLLFSGYFGPESRILFRRLIRRRAAILAPFLRFDGDPYAVITDSGRVKYVIDAYTVSSDYPYSERYMGNLGPFRGVNYIRNSVKVVVDAYDGTVDLYVIDEEDIILRTFQNIFPELFKPLEDMPEDLKDHLRYPADILTVQAEMYGTYHMEDPEVFYQREDVWQFATERYREQFQTVTPYYVMLNLPEDEADLEFALIVPFTPKNKNVMNAWMAGRCDFPNYGQIIVYTFPKGEEVLGPRHIEARIDQNSEMSRALSLWSQRGSQVIRGNLLTIPLFDGETLYLLYAEPIFLQAEDARLPEVKRIVLADQDDVVWSDTFDGALRLLLGRAAAAKAAEAPAEVPAAAAEAGVLPADLESLIDDASQAFRDYQRLMGAGAFARAGEMLDQLRSALQDLSDRLGSGEGSE